jgi:hypothetical protein
VKGATSTSVDRKASDIARPRKPAAPTMATLIRTSCAVRTPVRRASPRGSLGTSHAGGKRRGLGSPRAPTERGEPVLEHSNLSGWTQLQP